MLLLKLLVFAVHSKCSNNHLNSPWFQFVCSIIASETVRQAMCIEVSLLHMCLMSVLGPLLYYFYYL